MKKDRAKSIRRLSAFFVGGTLAYMILMPIGVLAFWVFFNTLPTELSKDIAIHQKVYSAMSRLAGFAAMSVPFSIYWLIAFQGHRLFKQYYKGEIFTQLSVEYLKKIGTLLLIATPASIFSRAALTVVDSWSLGEGNRQILIGIQNGDIEIAVIGCFIMVITSIMSDAVRMKRNQELTI